MTLHAVWMLNAVAVGLLAGCAQRAPAPLFARRDFTGLQYEATAYIAVRKYGPRYALLPGGTSVDVTVRTVDFRSGATLWSGEDRASSNDMDSLAFVDEGLVRRLMCSAIRHVVDKVSSPSFKVVGEASRRLPDPPRPSGILPSPRAR